MKIPDDWREFIALMNSHGVEYLLVGGHAVGFHGHPRLTGDIDFFVRPTVENAAALASVLEEFGFEKTAELRKEFSKPDKIVQLGRPPFRIDLLTSISGVDFADAEAGCKAAVLDGVPVRVIGKEALLTNKRASGRPKDLVDVAELQKVDQVKGR